MTQDDLTHFAAAAVRHGMTLGAGFLAAHGLAGGDQLQSIGGSVAVFAVTLGWSLIEKNKLIAQICNAIPTSEVEDIFNLISKFRANGSNPLLIANLAQTAMAVANAELLAAHPELAPPPPPTASAPAVEEPTPSPSSAVVSPAAETVKDPIPAYERSRLDIPGVTQ